MENTQIEVIAAISEYLGISPTDLDRGSAFNEDLNLGPVEFNDLVSHLSGKFSVILSSEDLSEVKTIDDLIVLIEDNLI